MLTMSAASAATLIPEVQVTGGTATNAIAINNNNDIAGSYTDSSAVVQAFSGTLAGVYQTYAYTLGANVTATYARGMDDGGDVTGYALAASELVGFEWERTAAGTMFTITDKKNKPLDGVAQQMRKDGSFTGSWVSAKAPNNQYPYIGNVWKLVKTVKISIASSQVAGRGINKAGDIVGWFKDSNSIQHGFTLIGGKTTQIDYPGGQTYTVLEGINDSGLVTGQFQDSSGNIRGFTLDTTTGKFKEIKVSGQGTLMQAFGINNAGWITLSTGAGNFIYCPGTKAKCKVAGAREGIEIADQPSISKPQGSFTVFMPTKTAGSHAKVLPLPKGALPL